MSFRFYKRYKGLNISKRGLSLTARWGKGFSTNFRGGRRRHVLNFGHGLSYIWTSNPKRAPEKNSWGKILPYISILLLTIYLL